MKSTKPQTELKVKVMEKKFPYNYRSIPLTSVKGSATFTGKPSKELLEAVNKMAELAFKQIKKENHDGKTI